MQRNRMRLVLACLGSALMAISFLAPATGATMDVDSARSAIWAVVQQADAKNQQILNQFTTDALSSTSMEELDAARDKAHWRLDDLWYSSVDQIESLAALYPDELGGDADSALGTLTRDHDRAHAEVQRIYATIAGGMGTTTTSTTTTTKPPTTTTSTKPPSATTSTTRPTTTTTTVARTTTTTSTTTTSTTIASDVTSTTRTPTTTTTTSGSGAAAPPSGGSGTPAVTDDPALDGAITVAAEASAADGSASVIEDVRAERTPASHMLMHTASVLLPPGLVEFAVSPFMAMEFLAWTLVEAIGSMLLPFLVLMAAVGWTMWRELRRRPGLARG